MSLSLMYCKSSFCVPLDLNILIIFVLSNRETRIGRMAYVRVMLMDLSCMRTGIKIYDSLVMGKMVEGNYFRFLLFIIAICAYALVTTKII
jgi:hypothetical protein